MADVQLSVTQRRSSIVDMLWRVGAIALGFTVVARIPALLTGPRPSLAPEYLQALAINLVTGAVAALVFLPLARRLPFGTRTRFVAGFVPLYLIGIVGNLVDA